MLDQNGMENTEIHTVAAAGNLARLRSLLDENPLLVEANGWFGTKPLHYAAVSDRTDYSKLFGFGTSSFGCDRSAILSFSDRFIAN